MQACKWHHADIVYRHCIILFAGLNASLSDGFHILECASSDQQLCSSWHSVIKDKQLLEVRADQQYSADQASNGTSADNSHSLAPHFKAL